MNCGNHIFFEMHIVYCHENLEYTVVIKICFVTWSSVAAYANGVTSTE